jgi:hypothetical protein
MQTNGIVQPCGSMAADPRPMPAIMGRVVSCRGTRSKCIAGVFVLIAVVACSETTQPRVPTSIQVSQTSVRMEEGESTAVTATLLDQNGNPFTGPVDGFAIIWSSSAPATASVDQGVITGETPGIAIVTVKAGPLPGAGIDVRIDAAPIEFIQLYAETNLLRIGTPLQLYAYVMSVRGYPLRRSVAWTSLDPDLATVSATGSLTGHAPGWARIAVSSEGWTDVRGFHIRPPVCSGTPVGVLARPGNVIGSLDPSDCDVPFDGPWPTAAFGEAWRLDLSEAAEVRLDLISDDFDAVLYLSDPDLDLIAYDDDGGVGLNARITRHLGAGSYLVWASSFFANETGEYELIVR